MSKYGYIVKESHSNYFVGELKSLVDQNCNDIFIEKGESNKYYSPELMKLIDQLEYKDEIILPHFSENYYSRFNQEDILLPLKELQIEVSVLSKPKLEVYYKKDNAYYLDVNTLISDFEKNKNYKKIMGRPKVPKDKVKEVVNFRLNDHLTYREISELTDLSVGTVYKYIRQYTNEKELTE